MLFAGPALGVISARGAVLVFTPATHQQVGKETGQTAHIERLNNTPRQRISRLVRKTLSFSKREYMLSLRFKLFAYFYNLEHLTA